MEPITISINLIIVLIAIAIFSAYKIYQDKHTIHKEEFEELDLNNEANEVMQTIRIEEQNFTAQDIKEECKKINDKIALTNILLFIIAIALIIIAVCTVQEYLFKKEVIDYTNKTINELYKMFN